MNAYSPVCKPVRYRLALFAFLFVLCAVSSTLAQRPVYQVIYNNDDAYTVRVSGYYWNADPSGSINTRALNQGELPLDGLTGLDSYPAIYIDGDWKFRPRQHIIFSTAPNSTQKTATLTAPIEFLNELFQVNATVTTKLRTTSVMAGYEYDFMRGPRGHLGVTGDIDFLDVSASIAGTGEVIDGNGNPIGTATVTKQRDEFVPLPSIGAEGKIFITEKLYGEGFIRGGYYFGYGHGWSAKGDVGLIITHNIDIKAGYLFGDRYNVRGVTDNTHVNLNQSGFIAGLQYSF